MGGGLKGVGRVPFFETRDSERDREAEGGTNKNWKYWLIIIHMSDYSTPSGYQINAPK